MNVDFPFITSTVAFWVIVGVMALMTVGLVFFFRRMTGR